MKVILKKEVKGQGKTGDVVTVSDGYARNYLIPNGLAAAATAESVNAAKIHSEAQQHKLEVEKETAASAAKELNGKTVTIAAKCGENGRAFGAITAKEISAALKEQHGADIDKKKIVLKDNIKEKGEYDVSVKLYANVTTKIKVIVTAEE